VTTRAWTGRIRKGPALMILASLCFTVMVVTVKVAREELGALECMIWRCAFSLPVAALMASRTSFRLDNRKMMAARGLLGFFAMMCWFVAAKGLSIANLSLLSKLEPILVAIIAPLWLGASERASRLVWAVLGTGIVGSAIVIGPDLAVGNAFGLWAVGSSFLAAGAHVSIRALAQTDAPEAVVFWFQVTTLIPALAIYAVLEGQALPLPPAHLWPWLAGTGVSAAVAQWLMTRAYQHDNAPTVAAASYASPLWAVVVDMIAFGVYPSAWSWLGGALIVGGGLFLLLRREGPTLAPRPIDAAGSDPGA
jgi:drug/metabolite transporter (DMT)-like permease